MTAAADEQARKVLGGPRRPARRRAATHRAVMSAAKTLTTCAVHHDSVFSGSTEAARATARLVEFLAGMQGENGLFDGENIQLPARHRVHHQRPVRHVRAAARPLQRPKALRPLAAALERIALAAAEPLRLGGVHTPNHRWELSAALARLNRHWPDVRLVERVDEWLSEGIDIAADGMYSERSPNYSLHVSNPSLTAIGIALDRPELLDAVCRNLEVVAATALPDGTVETVHSRRQDQRGTIALVLFMMQFRRFAIARGRGDFAAVVATTAEGAAGVCGGRADGVLRKRAGRAAAGGGGAEGHERGVRLGGSRGGAGRGLRGDGVRRLGLRRAGPDPVGAGDELRRFCGCSPVGPFWIRCGSRATSSASGRSVPTGSTCSATVSLCGSGWRRITTSRCRRSSAARAATTCLPMRAGSRLRWTSRTGRPTRSL